MRLRTVTRTSPWNAALKDGRVEPRGYTLEFEEVQPITQAFRIMSRELAYDVCEMAATTYFVFVSVIGSLLRIRTIGAPRWPDNGPGD